MFKQYLYIDAFNSFHCLSTLKAAKISSGFMIQSPDPALMQAQFC